MFPKTGSKQMKQNTNTNAPFTNPRDITVTSYRFRPQRTGSVQLACPKSIEFDGETVDFIDTGLSCTVRRGGTLSRILMMSDGLRQFRLKSDDRSSTWTLLSIG